MIAFVFGSLTFIAVALVARRIAAVADAASRSAVRRRSTGPTSDRAERLAELERGAVEATADGVSFHHRLRPQLRFVVIDRLRRRGIELDTDPSAPELLGPLAWALLRSDVPAPTTPTAGLTDHEVRALTEMLKRIR